MLLAFVVNLSCSLKMANRLRLFECCMKTSISEVMSYFGYKPQHFIDFIDFIAQKIYQY